MKLALIVLVSAIISVVVFYISGAFIANELNPGNWSSDGRAFMVLVSFCGAAGLSAIFFNLEK